MLRSTLSPLATAALIVVAIPSHGATVLVEESGCRITIEGPIDKKTPQQLEIAIRKMRATKVIGPSDNLFCNELGKVDINGPGGDVEAAIAMGRTIRREQLSTWVVREPCVSACVLVLIGGVSRGASREVGLHRPYSPEPSASMASAQARFERINGIIKTYLTEMNVPVRLLDVMNSVPPGEIRMLNPYSDEHLLQELSITGDDPVFSDMFATRLAGILGISKAEYYVRKQRARAECWVKNDRGRLIVKDSDLCEMAILGGKR